MQIPNSPIAQPSIIGATQDLQGPSTPQFSSSLPPIAFDIDREVPEFLGKNPFKHMPAKAPEGLVTCLIRNEDIDPGEAGQEILWLEVAEQTSEDHTMEGLLRYQGKFFRPYDRECLVGYISSLSNPRSAKEPTTKQLIVNKHILLSTGGAHWVSNLVPTNFNSLGIRNRVENTQNIQTSSDTPLYADSAVLVLTGFVLLSFSIFASSIVLFGVGCFIFGAAFALYCYTRYTGRNTNLLGAFYNPQMPVHNLNESTTDSFWRTPL